MFCVTREIDLETGKQITIIDVKSKNRALFERLP